MAYKITSGPASEPVTLAEAKAWLKIHEDVSDDDDLIRSLIASARKWAEHGTGRALMTQTVQEVWDSSYTRCFYLSLGPVASVTKFEYRDGNGNYQEWASSNYIVDDVTEPARVVVKSNVSLPYMPAWSDVYPNMIRITYTVGKESPAEVDANIKTAMLLQIGLMYENREDMPLGKDGNTIARSAWNLLAVSRLSFI